MNDVSDGYHTFDELYDHRNWLFAALVSAVPQIAWKSKWHHDGTIHDGSFIAGMNLYTGPISYHLPLRMWEAVQARVLERAPKWDGYTSSDVVERLKQWVGSN